MKVVFSAVLLLCLSFSVESEAKKLDGRVFLTRAEVEADASARLAGRRQVAGKATMPANTNYVRVEGGVAASYGSAFQITVPGDVTRFECPLPNANGCLGVADWDHLLVYGHLGGTVSCSYDGPSPVALVNLLYRRTYAACGDRTCEVWTLLSQ